MKVELVSVLEIGYNNQGVKAPDKYPYWDNPEIWDEYHQLYLKKAGFKDGFIPYLKGSSFYKLSDITVDNLTKLVKDHTQDLRDGKYERDQACTFWGGYVLRIDGQDKYFPQSSGELSDIHYWESLSNGKSSFCEGLPSPKVKFEKDSIVLDFSVGEHDEQIEPTPKGRSLLIDVQELKKAIENVRSELEIFEQRLIKINEDEKLGIDNIGGLLIWENANLSD